MTSFRSSQPYGIDEVILPDYITDMSLSTAFEGFYDVRKTYHELYSATKVHD